MGEDIGFKQLFDLVTTRVKTSVTRMLFPGGHGNTYGVFGKSSKNYATSVGDGRGNAIVMGVIEWMCRVFPEAPLQVEQITSGNKSKTVEGHPMELLIKRPNPFYSGTLLMNGTLGDWMLGNAYWRVIPSKAGTPLELWWIPSKYCRAVWPKDGVDFISYYEYDLPNGEKVQVDPKYMIHLRNGLDPENPRMGLTKLGSLLREIYTDDEAANFTASLLSNLGVPGMIISAGDDKVKITDEEAKNIKATAENRFGGDNRGRVMVLTGMAKIDRLSFNPSEMNLKDMRRLPEERITALWGVPAVVVGLGAGLDRSTFANFAEAREAAYEGVIMPNQRLIAEELASQLLPFYESDPTKFNVFFNNTKVRALQADQGLIHTMARDDFKAGIITLDESRELTGFDPLPNSLGKIFAVPMSVTYVPAEELYVEPQPIPAALAAAAPQNALPPGNEGSNPPPDNSGDAQTGDNLSASASQGKTLVHSANGKIDPRFLALSVVGSEG